MVGVFEVSQSVSFKRGLLFTSLYMQTAAVRKERKETACHHLKNRTKIIHAYNKKLVLTFSLAD